jgi:hypothetical protein
VPAIESKFTLLKKINFYYQIDSHCDAAFSMISRPTNTDFDTLHGMTEETIEAS